MTMPLPNLKSSKRNQLTNIRMSKMDRLIQSAAAKTNWNEMAKMLFRTLGSQGPQGKNSEFISPQETLSMGGFNNTNYSSGQLHYTVILMVIISIAEKRTEEHYEKNFTSRCDAISKTYDLKDDQYWTSDRIPAEWEKLNTEFEHDSKRILVDTLREYDQKEIADLVQQHGPDQIFNVIQKIKSQYLKAIKNCSTAKDYFGKTQITS
jgi:hypothetical protein